MLRPLEKATLRPVPLRPPGPVDHAEAAAHVVSALPELDEGAARALALIEIAGQSRSEVATAIALAPETLAVALTRARKALRRTIFPLSASGWCERAERMISDRIDGELRAPGPRRLQVHLENCDRCVEHDRRLAQARDQLVRSFIDAHPHADVAPLRERTGAGLRIVRPTLVEPAPVPDGPVVPSFAGPVAEPRGEETASVAPTFSGPDDGWTPPPVERRAEAPQVDDLPADPPPIERDIAPAEPADATPSETEAEPGADPPVEAAVVELPAAEPVVTEPVVTEPVVTEPVVTEPVVTEAEPAATEAVAETVATEGPTAAEPSAAEPARAPARPVPAPAPLRSPATLLWTALYGIAVLFAVLTVVLLVLALAGVDRVI